MARKMKTLMTYLFLMTIESHFPMITTQMYRHCPQNNATNELKFSSEPGNLAITCDMQSTDLTCCTEGYSEIKWFKEQEDNGWNEIVPNQQMYMPPGDNNQTLRLVYPQIRYDKTKFMCIAWDASNNTINNTIYLDIRECGFWRLPPIITRLTKEDTPGTNSTTLTCQVFPGPRGKSDHDPLMTQIYWKSLKTDKIGNGTAKLYFPQMKMENDDLNITETYSGQFKYSMLTVERLSSSQNFTCIAMNVFGKEEQFFEIQSLQTDKKNPANFWEKYNIHIILALVSLALLACLLGIICYHVSSLAKDRREKMTALPKYYYA